MTVHGNSFWEIVKPLETTNLVQNPSVETNTTGYAAASGATIARSTASQFFGSYSLQVTPTSASSDGVYYGANSLPVGLTNGSTYSFSVFFKGQSSIPYSIYFADTSGTLVGSSLDFTATGDWERKNVTYAATTASRRLYVVKDNSANTGNFFVDGLQCERVGNSGASPTTYADGDQPGCVWLAQAHASQSWRDGESRAGGEIVNLNNDYDIIVRQQPGAGMPPVENVSTNLGIQDGGLYQRTKTQSRSFTLEGVVTGSDVSDFHYNRNRLLDLFKPDGGTPQQPFLLRYNSGSSITKQIETHYDAGFELNQVTAEIEEFSLRLISYQPYWEEIKDTAQQLTSSASFATAGAVRKTTNHLGNEGNFFSINAFLRGFSFNPDDRKLYYIVATGDQIPQRYNIQREINVNFVPTTAGCKFHLAGADDGGILDTATDSQGNVYFVGTFIGAGSTAATNIVKWNGIDYEAVGDGLGTLGEIVYTVEVDKRTNTIYAGGTFDASGSITACMIAKFVPGATEWEPVGDGFKTTVAAGNDGVWSIGLEKSGSNLYAGGDFTDSGSITGTCGLAYFNGVEFEPVGGASIGTRVTSIVVKDDDTVFIGGNFTGTFPDSAGSPQNFTYWNKTNFTIGADVSPTGCVLSMSYNSIAGELAVSTDDEDKFPGLATPGRAAIWNGNLWKYPPAKLLARGEIFYEDYLFAFSGATGTNLTPSRSVVNNPGTATVFPKIVFASPSTTASNALYFIENSSTSKNIQFDFSILGGETVTLDLEQGTVTSDFKGSIIGNILPGSNFATWFLQPGDNIVLPLVEDSSTSLLIQWKNKYWSIDGGET